MDARPAPSHGRRRYAGTAPAPAPAAPHPSRPTAAAAARSKKPLVPTKPIAFATVSTVAAASQARPKRTFGTVRSGNIQPPQPQQPPPATKPKPRRVAPPRPQAVADVTIKSLKRSGFGSGEKKSVTPEKRTPVAVHKPVKAAPTDGETPYLSAQNCSNCRLDRLESAVYWLQQIRLAESVGKHAVAAAFFRLALDCQAQPFRQIEIELRSYIARHQNGGAPMSLFTELLQAYRMPINYLSVGARKIFAFTDEVEACLDENDGASCQQFAEELTFCKNDDNNLTVVESKEEELQDSIDDRLIAKLDRKVNEVAVKADDGRCSKEFVSRNIVVENTEGSGHRQGYRADCKGECKEESEIACDGAVVISASHSNISQEVKESDDSCEKTLNRRRSLPFRVLPRRSLSADSSKRKDEAHRNHEIPGSIDDSSKIKDDEDKKSQSPIDIQMGEVLTM